jgi:hypothetical protein
MRHKQAKAANKHAFCFGFKKIILGLLCFGINNWDGSLHRQFQIKIATFLTFSYMHF